MTVKRWVNCDRLPKADRYIANKRFWTEGALAAWELVENRRVRQQMARFAEANRQRAAARAENANRQKERTVHNE